MSREADLENETSELLSKRDMVELSDCRTHMSGTLKLAALGVVILVGTWTPLVVFGLADKVFSGMIAPAVAYLTIAGLVLPALICVRLEMLRVERRVHARTKAVLGTTVEGAVVQMTTKVEETVSKMTRKMEENLSSLEKSIVRRFEDIPPEVRQAVKEEFDRAKKEAKEEEKKLKADEKQEVSKLEGVLPGHHKKK